MNHTFFRRSLSILLALAMMLIFCTAAFAAEQTTPTAPSGTPGFTLVEIKGTDVIMEGNEFPYTGQPIEPNVTVTVDGQELIRNQDYTVTYINNLAPGTGTLTVRGIGTASETVGYYGKVTMDFTIVKAIEPEKPADPTVPSEPEKPTEPTAPSEPEKPSDPTVPSEPEKPSDPTVPSDPEKPTEPSKPEEGTRPDYKITKGSSSRWNQKSGKDLSFTVNADTDDITGVRIDGKTLNTSHYTLGKNGILTLKNSWLEKQAIGTYRLTLQFEDGSAEGTFKVLAPVDSTNPQTGDTVVLWIGAMTASLLGLAVLVLSGKRIFR